LGAALENQASGPAEGHASELRNLLHRYEALRAEKTILEGALAAAQEERAGLAQELKALRSRAAPPSDEIRAENADLRRRLDELAERLMQGTDPANAPAETGRRPARV
jgi:predicted  nucleic acid-binding Zn-ribbon protein